MYSIYFGAALGCAIGILLACIGKKDLGKFIGGMLGGAFVGAIVALLVGLTVISSMVRMKDNVYGPAALVAMRSSDGVSGTFVWGLGSINSRTTYNFLQKMDDGSMVPGFIYADGLVHLIEDAELKNVGYWSTTIREVDKTDPLYKWSIAASDRNETIRQEFRVPVGTVVQQFNVK